MNNLDMPIRLSTLNVCVFGLWFSLITSKVLKGTKTGKVDMTKPILLHTFYQPDLRLIKLQDSF